MASSANTSGAVNGEVSVGELTLDHDTILTRKDFLKNYLVKVVSNEDWSPESKMWA